MLGENEFESDGVMVMVRINKKFFYAGNRYVAAETNSRNKICKGAIFVSRFARLVIAGRSDLCGGFNGDNIL